MTTLPFLQFPKSSLNHSSLILIATVIETPLGKLLSISDDTALYLLEFVDKKNLQREIQQIVKFRDASIIQGSTLVTEKLKQQLKEYFGGTLESFNLPLIYPGTLFQKKIWGELSRISYGETISYRELAEKIGQPTAFRAAANANGANQFVIIIPCHRVINSNGHLGGYSCGLERKKWLLEHEQQHQKKI